MRTAYKVRAYPRPEQTAQLGRTFGCVRLVWNKTLDARHRVYHEHGKKTSYKETDANLTAWKKTDELSFLGEVSSVPLQQTLRHQHTAYANFFAGRAKYPRFKSRNGKQSAHYTRSAFSLRDGKLKLAKHAQPLGEFRRQVEYKAARAGKTVVIVSRWYPTSKTCSTCGCLSPKLDLSTRRWTCTGCGTRHDRDHNAAKNILAAGRAVVRVTPGDACGADNGLQGSSLRPSVLKQEGSGASPVGIPRR